MTFSVLCPHPSYWRRSVRFMTSAPPPAHPPCPGTSAGLENIPWAQAGPVPLLPSWLFPVSCPNPGPHTEEDGLRSPRTKDWASCVIMRTLLTFSQTGSETGGDNGNVHGRYEDELWESKQTPLILLTPSSYHWHTHVSPGGLSHFRSSLYLRAPVQTPLTPPCSKCPHQSCLCLLNTTTSKHAY